MILSISLLTLLFALNEFNGEMVQILGVLVFIAAGVQSLVAGNRNAPVAIDETVLLICIALPFVSISSLFVGGQMDLIPQSVAFMICAISARLIVVKNGVNYVLNAFTVASCALAFFAFIFEFPLLVDCLRFEIDTSNSARLRFNPFNNHPNLTGHILGVVLICTALYCYWHNANRKPIWYFSCVATVVCVPMIGATSSRGTLVALSAAALGLIIAYAIKNKAAQKKLITAAFVLGVLFLIVGSVNADEVLVYFTELFELESTQRGMDSGMTGRSDNWLLIIGLSFETAGSIVFGNGIRSFNESYYGVATDSSYINSLWESGLFLTIAVIFILLRKIYRFGNISRTYVADIYFSILVFALVESFVARYLLGIGNPGTIIILILLLTPESLILKNQRKSI